VSRIRRRRKGSSSGNSGRVEIVMVGEVNGGVAGC
jgi:hypothetical protein